MLSENHLQINLSGGQKARSELITFPSRRANNLLKYRWLGPCTLAHPFCFSMTYFQQVRSSTQDHSKTYLQVFLVDVHTAHHLFHKCLKGDLAHGRTIVLVSHHVQLYTDGAEYIVALDNGRTMFAGKPEDFKSSGAMAQLIQSGHAVSPDGVNKGRRHKSFPFKPSASAEALNALPGAGEPPPDLKVKRSSLSEDVPSPSESKIPRKLVEEEKRAVGHIGKDVWKAYFSSVGGVIYWITFAFSIVLAAAGPVAENGWLRFVLCRDSSDRSLITATSSYWSRLVQNHRDTRGALHYITIYALVSAPLLRSSELLSDYWIRLRSLVCEDLCNEHVRT